MNFKKKPVQPNRIIYFLLLLFFITPGFSVEGAHLRKVPVTLAQPSEFLANGTNEGLNISDIESTGSTTSFDMVLSSAADCYVQDPGFELSVELGGPPYSQYWDEYSNIWGSPLATYDPYVGNFAHSGIWWAWFGGIPDREEGWIEQTVRFPAGGIYSLDFYLAIPDAEKPGYLKVFLDGDLLFEATEADKNSYADYTRVSLNVSAYADGGDHLLRFESITEASGSAITNFWVDDICVRALVMPWIPLLLLD